MEGIMNIDPGLVFWTLVNFGIFLFILIKIGAKPMIKALNQRENTIKETIENAEIKYKEAQQFLEESKQKLSEAQKDMMVEIDKGKEQAEKIINKALQEAEAVKKQKIEDTLKEIDRNKEIAIKELRTEVADLVVQATEKILDESLDKDKHYKLIEKYIDQLPKN